MALAACCSRHQEWADQRKKTTPSRYTAACLSSSMPPTIWLALALDNKFKLGLKLAAPNAKACIRAGMCGTRGVKVHRSLTRCLRQKKMFAPDQARSVSTGDGSLEERS